MACRSPNDVTVLVHFAYHLLEHGTTGMARRLSRKAFRTTVILTELQHKRILEIAEANDASIAWVLRQALDRYLETEGKPTRGSDAKTCPSSGSDV